MADDGLLLNFNINDDLLKPIVTVKGGTWRARRREQKREQAVRSNNGVQENAVSVSKARKDLHDHELIQYRATKRRKVSGDFSPAVVASRNRTEHHAQPNAPKQIISSLFTSNPVSKVQSGVPDVADNDTNVVPSNAPLTNEQFNFTNLGLNATIAAHLTQKLDVSAPTAIQKVAIPRLLQGDTDAFIQAETGSGKTLAYLLPILQRLMQASKDLKEEGKGALHRDSGVFAIILAPTRELSKQITAVLDSLLRCTPWLVSGSVIGGEKKKSEKARLRKGLNILVATPGRLADHLDHTEVLDVSNVRWLVLDEGDRLMELGFENDIKKILNKLDNRMKRGSKQPVEGLPTKRINILCSATMKADVQRLGDLSLKEAKHIEPNTTGTEIEAPNSEENKIKFSAPAQLKQSYAIVPAKLRLVTLIAFLKRTFARKSAVSKVIVFVSCADSVDFHFDVFTRCTEEVVDGEGNKSIVDTDIEDYIPKVNEKRALTKSGATPKAHPHDPTRNRRQSAPSIDPDKNPEPTTSAPASIVSTSETITAFRLHGSLPQKIRTKTIQAFANSKSPSFLLCTDVASRGLDLPNVDLVVEYDPPFSADEHLHRIGRTARAGRDGRAIIFLLPGCEEGYVEILKSLRRDEGMSIVGHDANELLRKGLSMLPGKTVKEAEEGWQQRATDLQLDVERWILENPRMLEMARRGYQSHVRAYATHVAAERGIFDIKQLHLGHLAKAFGLRDRPGNINVPGMRASAAKVKAERAKAGAGGVRKATAKRGDEGVHVHGGGKDDRKRKVIDFDLPDQTQTNANEARTKMQVKMKMMQRVSAGAGEFNLA